MQYTRLRLRWSRAKLRRTFLIQALLRATSSWISLVQDRLGIRPKFQRRQVSSFCHYTLFQRGVRVCVWAYDFLYVRSENESWTFALQNFQSIQTRLCIYIAQKPVPVNCFIVIAVTAHLHLWQLTIRQQLGSTVVNKTGYWFHVM